MRRSAASSPKADGQMPGDKTIGEVMILSTPSSVRLALGSTSPVLCLLTLSPLSSMRFFAAEYKAQSTKQVLDTPTREEIQCMNQNYTVFGFPQIKAHPWHKFTIVLLLRHLVTVVTVGVANQFAFSLLTWGDSESSVQVTQIGGWRLMQPIAAIFCCKSELDYIVGITVISCSHSQIIAAEQV